MKKKISPIKLHNLSEAEMATRELNLLRGGSGSDKRCPCVSACLPYNCACGSSLLTNTIKANYESLNDKNQSDKATGEALMGGSI